MDSSSPDGIVATDVAPVSHRARSRVRWVATFALAGALFLAAGVGVGWFLAGSQTQNPSGVDEVASSAGKQQSKKVSSRDLLFVPPADMDEFIKEGKKVTVTVLCNGGTGAGWIIDTPAEPVVRPKMQADYGDQFAQVVVTAEHVIRDCRRKGLDVGVVVSESLVPAVLMNWDKENDVATIGIKTSQTGVPAFTSTPEGTWAVTIGAPIDEYLVPTIGQVVHNDGFNVLLHMTSRPGNSGGPIFNSRGEVVATLGGTILDEEFQSPTGWSYSTPANLLCARLFDCSLEGIDAES
jgi:S1-C subfamily serine protease